MIAFCTGLHLARGAWCPASPVSGVHVPCLMDSSARARFRRAPMPRRSSWSSNARSRLRSTSPVRSLTKHYRSDAMSSAGSPVAKSGRDASAGQLREHGLWLASLDARCRIEAIQFRPRE